MTAETAVIEGGTSPHVDEGRRGWWPPARWGLSWSGLVGAVVGLWAALTPSLLPRPTLFLGLIAGIGMAVGYGVGVLVAWVLRKVGVRGASADGRRRAWRVLAVAGPVLAIPALVVGTRWQDDVRLLVGQQPDTSALWTTAAIGILTAAVLLLVSRGLRRVGRLVGRGLATFLPRPVATILGGVVVVLVGVWAVTGLAERSIQAIGDRIYAPNNDTTPPGVTQPASPLRSGSAESLVAWGTLGRQGRAFVAGGPTVQQLGEFGDTDPKEPIRVYVGLETSDSALERGRIAVEELKRTGAFDRKLLVVAGATGTGWLEPQSVDAIEYMWGGDTAIVTSQYSYLPSWMSFLVDQQRAADAGRELFDAVHAAWAQLPEGKRPLLMVYGLSLGSYSIQSAFGSAGDIAARTDGAVFVGSPSFAQPWGDITRTRDADSPQWRPVYRDGTTVRFGGAAADYAAPPGPWRQPRVAYLQHADDPVVWWSPDLILQRPDWLAEPRGPSVSDSMHWIPILTFVQVTVDQFFGTAVPNGYGHNYPANMVGTLAAVLPPPDWSQDKADRLQGLIDTYPFT